MAEVEMTNICMVYDKVNKKVLVQERKKNWKGIAFPGGHVEDGESIVESTIREIKEETGLTVTDLKQCGILYWYNDESKQRYIVFCFKTDSFTGELVDETPEGRVFWVGLNDLFNLNLAKGFEKQLDIFLNEQYCEAFTVWNSKGDNGLNWF